jgi:hypothetical protein
MTRKTILLLGLLAAPGWGAVSIVTRPGEVITAPRPGTAPTRLLFPYATGTGAVGWDTDITLANTSLDTLGTTPQGGACTLSFYGSNAPAAQTTAYIAAGQHIVISLSAGGFGIAAAPNFTGYIMASCGFPLARGVARVYAPTGHLALTVEAQAITTPRSTVQPQTFLLPFASNQNGADTGIAIANTSLDPFGTAPTAGSCTLRFYDGAMSDGASQKGPFNTGTIAAGTTYTNLLSAMAPGFQGYVTVSCNFTGAAVVGFVSDVGARNMATTVNAELLTAPRSTTAQPLLFPSLVNAGGRETVILLANTSADHLGTAHASGACTLSFFGNNARTPFTTPNITWGAVWSASLSVIAPGFRGYVMVVCPFAHARGLAITGEEDHLTSADTGSVTPEVVAQPRSTTPASLLFAASDWGGSDTNIAISNTSLDSLGTSPGSGPCTISYFGEMYGGEPTPRPQTSTVIPAGGQLIFSVTGGNPTQGIAATPGFRGYIIADCGFPLARGVATSTYAFWPAAGAIDPASGSGNSQTYNFRFSHPGGYQELGVVNVLINNFLDGRHACYLAYSVSGNTLYLVNDAGDAGGPFAGSTPLDNPHTIQNSQCAVAPVFATGNGTLLTLRLNITFKAGFGGNRILYTAARDQLGGNSGWQTLGVWQAPFTPPGTIAVTSASPAQGNGATVAPQAFAFTLTDSKGAADIGIVNVLLNKSIDGREACYLAYSVASNTLYLVDDAGNAGGPFAGSLLLNGAGSIQNGQCQVSGAGSSAALSGNNLTLTLNLTFLPGLVGKRVVWVAGRDRADGNNTDWQAMGTWIVQ